MGQDDRSTPLPYMQQCPDDGAKTNADRIRSMTDKELAEWLSKRGHQCPEVYLNCNKGIVDSEDDCYPCWLDWLREEAET